MDIDAKLQNQGGAAEQNSGKSSMENEKSGGLSGQTDAPEVTAQGFVLISNTDAEQQPQEEIVTSALPPTGKQEVGAAKVEEKEEEGEQALLQKQERELEELKQRQRKEMEELKQKRKQGKKDYQGQPPQSSHPISSSDKSSLLLQEPQPTQSGSSMDVANSSNNFSVGTLLSNSNSNSGPNSALNSNWSGALPGSNGRSMPLSSSTVTTDDNDADDADAALDFSRPSSLESLNARLGNVAPFGSNRGHPPLDENSVKIDGWFLVNSDGRHLTLRETSVCCLEKNWLAGSFFVAMYENSKFLSSMMPHGGQDNLLEPAPSNGGDKYNCPLWDLVWTLKGVPYFRGAKIPLTKDDLDSIAITDKGKEWAPQYLAHFDEDMSRWKQDCEDLKKSPFNLGATDIVWMRDVMFIRALNPHTNLPFTREGMMKIAATPRGQKWGYEYIRHYDSVQDGWLTVAEIWAAGRQLNYDFPGGDMDIGDTPTLNLGTTEGPHAATAAHADAHGHCDTDRINGRDVRGRDDPVPRPSASNADGGLRMGTYEAPCSAKQDTRTDFNADPSPQHESHEPQPCAESSGDGHK